LSTTDAGLADCCAILNGRFVHRLPPLFQYSGRQVWWLAFEPQDPDQGGLEWLIPQVDMSDTNSL
jgi:hypothetical protein